MFVDLPVNFQIAELDDKYQLTGNYKDQRTVDQIYELSKAEGGSMIILSSVNGTSGPTNHNVVWVNGSDSQSKALFSFIANYPGFKNGNPELLAALRNASEGNGQIVFARGNLSDFPEKYMKDDVTISKQGYQIEGQYYLPIPNGAGGFSGFVAAPFQKGGKTFVLMFMDDDASLTNALNKGETTKDFAISALAGQIKFVMGIFGRGNVPAHTLNLEQWKVWITDLTNFLSQNDPSLDTRVVE